MISSKNKQHFFFDFDGTLADSLGTMYETYAQFARLHNISPSQEEFNTLNGPTIEEACAILQNKYQITTPIKDLFDQYLTIIHQAYAHIQAYPDATSLLHYLSDKQKTMTLVTSNLEKNIYPLVEKFKWETYFKTLITGEKVKKSKPHPEIYQIALKTYSQLDLNHV
ncbi:MAG: HAD hydrolase-like protein, partial [Bdellovibrionales bacterium]|nr:HAD hydrolase-like protein [Bdellovibrionales bacterium]